MTIVKRILIALAALLAPLALVAPADAHAGHSHLAGVGGGPHATTTIPVLYVDPQCSGGVTGAGQFLGAGHARCVPVLVTKTVSAGVTQQWYEIRFVTG